MILSCVKKIWLYPEVVDFRKQLNVLIVLIVEALHKDPGSGELFIFRNRARNKLKMVYFDGRLFWLARGIQLVKRLMDAATRQSPTKALMLEAS